MSVDASDPKTFALFHLNNAQLKRRGLTPEQIQELRRIQHEAPPARSVDEVRTAMKAREALVNAPAPTTRRTTRHEASE